MLIQSISGLYKIGDTIWFSGKSSGQGIVTEIRSGGIYVIRVVGKVKHGTH